MATEMRLPPRTTGPAPEARRMSVSTGFGNFKCPGAILRLSRGEF